VYNPAYIHQEQKPIFIRESSSRLAYERERRRLQLAEDEIAAIRIVLQRLAILRTLNCADVEDLVQETLLTMITKSPEGELEKGLLVWTLGILRNKLGNYYRKSHRFPVLGNPETAPRRCGNQSDALGSPEARFFAKELRTIVDQKVSELPDSQREVMELLVAGLDTGEIVSQLHPERYQNVVNRLHRGRKKLAMELAKYGYGPGSLTALKRAKRK
jgi:RNA polymerase sigma factor (sigma-70 family)